MVGDVFAQAQPPADQQAQAARTLTFNIPAQSLAQALTALGQQAGLQIAISDALVAGKTSVPVSGVMTPEQALRQMLAGTGITYRFTSPNAVTVSGAPDASGALQLDPVQVQGVFPVPSQAMIDNIPPAYAGGQVATGGQLGLLGNRGVMETPFNQTSYTAQKAQDQQAQTIRDVLIDDPSVRIVRPTGNNGAQNMMIRGFTVESMDIAYGGLYGLLPTYSVGVELAERIEVLKGPSAMLNGMAPSGAIGGTINVVPKRAHDEPMNRVTAAYSSVAQFGGAIDVGRRFGPDKELGVRFNGAYRAGQTAVMWNAEETGLGSIGVDYRGDGFRLSFDGGYQSQYISGGIGYVSVGAGAPVPGVPDLNNNFILPWSFTTTQDLFGALRAEVDVWPGVTLYGAIGAHDNRWSSLWSGDPIVNNLNGPGSATQTPLYNTSYETKWTSEIGLRGEAETGPVGHSFAVSATRYQQVFGFGRGIGTAYDSNIYSPNVIARPNIIDHVAAQVEHAATHQPRHRRHAVIRREARTAHAGRALPAAHGREFRPRDGQPHLRLPAGRDQPLGRAGRAALEGSVVLRQLHPGSSARHGRRPDLRQCRRDLRALQVDAVRVRHQDRLGQVHHDAQCLPDQPAQRRRQRRDQHAHAERPAAQSRHRAQCVRHTDRRRAAAGRCDVPGGDPGQHARRHKRRLAGGRCAQRAGQPGRANGTRPSRGV